MDRKRKLDSEVFPSQRCPRIDKKSAFELIKSGNLNQIIQIHNSDQINLLNDRDDEKQKTYLHKVLEGCYCDKSFNKIKATLKYILSKAPQLTGVCHRGSTPETPIMMACRLNVYHEAIEMLLQANPASVNETHTADKLTPLMNLVCLHHPWKDEVNKRASFRKSANIKNALVNVELLIANGANVNAEDSEGRNALQNVLFSEDNKILSSKDERLNIDPYPYWSEQMINLLLKNGSKLLSSLTNTHALAYVNSVSEAKLILDHDSSEINCVDKKGWTPLHHVLSRCEENTCDIVEFLVDSGANTARDNDVIHVAKDEAGEYSLVSKLLKKFPDYDVNTKDKHGQTLLMFFVEEQEAVQELLGLGADACLVDNAGNSVLSYINPNQTNAINIIKILLEKGADPCQNFNPTKNCIILQICEHILKSNIKFDEWFALFSSMLNLPQMRDDPMPDNVKQIYTNLFKIIFNFSYLLDIRCSESIWKIHVKCVSQLLIKICMSNPCVHDLLIPCTSNIATSLFSIDHVMKFRCPKELDPFTYGMYIASENIDTFRSEKRFEEYVTMLIDSGLLCSKTPDKCITALTMLFLVLRGKTSVRKEVRLSLCKKLIENKVNVESSSLKIIKVLASIFEDTFNRAALSNLKTENYLPDVLLLAFLFRYDECIEMLMSHWWAPPLALFAFHPSPTLADFIFWLPIFQKYARIPHGTDLFRRVKFHTHLFNDIMEENEMPVETHILWASFLVFLETPLPLMEICMFHIRQPLAKEAIKSDTSFPILLKEELPDYDFPPLLRPVISDS